MRNFTKLLIFFIGILSFNFCWADHPVKITVDWEQNSYEYKVEVYDQANNLILTICNSNIPDPDNPVSQCYNADGTEEIFTATYDLGCLQNGNYYIRLFSIDDDSWSSKNTVKVNVDGTDVINDDGSNASSTGFDINFSLTGVSAACNPIIEPDTDGDGVIDRIDLDDDNDGILDTDEGLGINTFDCTIPALNFKDNVLDSGTDGAVGAIYRFPNAIFGEPYDVLVEVLEIRNTTLIDIDDDSVDNENYLQTRLEFTGNETPADCGTCDYPGITFQFTIVDSGTSTPAATLFRIGGTTWDVDGPEVRRESVRYYGPSAYGTDNPTTLQVNDVNGDKSVIEMTAGGILEGPGFSTLPQLRSYFQFLSNTFTLRMQNVRTTYTGTNAREYGMSFTQCDVLDFESASITIVNGRNDDGDGLDNQVDLDSDNDGIPDNVEAQPTIGYIPPSNNIDPLTGLDASYASGMTYVDTDGDRLFDFQDKDSDGDGKPDIEENGLANSIVTPSDADKDGLDDIFETNGSEALNSVFDVNEDIENPSDLSILPDTDADLGIGGDLDYRDAIDVFIPSASVDFDGVDDHISEDSFMTGWQDATIMAWIKLDPTFSSDGDIAGQGLMRMYVNGTTRKLQSYYITSTGSSGYGSTSNTTLELDQWHHVAITYQGSSGMTKIYIDGELDKSGSIPSGTLSTDPVFADPDFNIGRHSRLDNSYFKGAIDEVRVFDTILTDSQLQQMVHQEIEEDGGMVKGTVLDKGIMDLATSATIPWSRLQAYYPMTNILTGKTTDASVYGRDGALKNIFTVQSQTAPMPYETVADGPWTTSNTWLHGDVWNITNITTTTRDMSSIKEWAIVRIRNNVQAGFSIKSLGLLIDTDKTLSVTGDNFIENTWFFALNGTLDLSGDSQLIQGPNSDLVTSATGRILRRQEGNADSYWYNYWSSPVGTPGVTSFSNNNGSSNNTNNSPFNIDMLQDGSGTPIEFTSSFDEVGKVSNRWLFSFQNGLTYFDWTTLTTSSDIAPGLGYTQKGTGNAGTEQQYIFDGKPNNGTILVAADDVDGDSGNESEQDVTLTTTLVGNPYPSALDARQFISDNAGVIQGTILLWEQWAGSSHLLAEYEGGYGYINSMTTERAYQYPGIPIADQVQTQGIKVPTFYIPVGQGFFVEVVDDGDIEFNNGQRAFVLESDADGIDPENGSSFFRNAQQDNADAQEEARSNSQMQILRLEFGVSSGASRSFVLGFSDFTTDGFDYGYDGGLITSPPADDMGSILNGDQYVIQAYAPITPQKEVDLVMHSSGSFSHTLKATEITNIPGTQPLLLRDNLTGNVYDLRSSEPYSFNSDAGTFNDRFQVIFEDPTLSTDDIVIDGLKVFMDNGSDRLFVKGLDTQVKSMTLTNLLGQTATQFRNIDSVTLQNGVYIKGLSSGVYLVNITTDDNLKLTKKIILD